MESGDVGGIRGLGLDVEDHYLLILNRRAFTLGEIPTGEA